MKLYKLLDINNKTYIINILYKLIKFYSIIIKPFYIKELLEINKK